MVVGRPKLDLDVNQIKKLAEIHCTMTEIASIMNCSVDTLENNYSGIIKAAHDRGKCSIRRAQIKKALEGNPALLIWLGKHMLGQHDIVSLTSEEPSVRKLLEKWEHHVSKGHNAKVRAAEEAQS